MGPTPDGATEPIRRICVYCASSTGTNRAVRDAAVHLGRQLAADGIELVYGGGAVGLMGIVADEVLAGGGAVTGVIPSALMPREVAHRGITELIEVRSMHERKAAMIDRADAFVALPGGFGTLEELAEVLTWGQLRLHAKPVGLLNVDGFFDPLLAFFDRCVADGLLKHTNRTLLIDHQDPAALLAALRSPRPIPEPKWSPDLAP